jgi:hypothetical protein
MRPAGTGAGIGMFAFGDTHGRTCGRKTVVKIGLVNVRANREAGQGRRRFG